MSQSIPCPLTQAAQQSPEAPAVIWGARRITFRQLNQFVNTTVKALKERNLKTGSRVALLAGNTVESVIVLLSLWRLGAVVCPVNPRFPDATVTALLKDLKASAIIVDQPGALGGVRLGIAKIFITDLIVFDVKDSFYKNDLPPVEMPSQQEAAVILTSGSSGGSKAAVLTYGNLYFNALGSNAVIALAPGDRWALSLPLFHVSGLGVIMRCLTARAAIVIAPQERLAELIAQGKVTHVSLVPAQLQRLLNDKAFTSRIPHPTVLRAILLGGSAIAPRLLEASLRLELPLYISYGLTEMASQAATGRVQNREGSPSAVVACLPRRELMISPDGEICVRGQTLFKGYLKDGRLELPLDEGGWFHTGDLGALDAHGGLHVTGRRDNMFISGGENVHPEEIERALLAIDGIAQAVVVARDDETYGQRPVAFLQWQEGVRPKSVEDIVQSLSQQLPKFKIPVSFLPWLDDHKGLKPDRKALAALVRKSGS